MKSGNSKDINRSVGDHASTNMAPCSGKTGHWNIPFNHRVAIGKKLLNTSRPLSDIKIMCCFSTKMQLCDLSLVL